MSRSGRLTGLVLVASVLVAACSGDDETTTPTDRADTAPPTPTAGAPVTTTAPDAGDTTSPSTSSGSGASASAVPDTADITATTEAAGPSTTTASAARAGGTTTTALADPAVTTTIAVLDSSVLNSIVADPRLADLLDQIPAWLEDPELVPEDAFEPAFLAEVPLAEVRAGLASLGGGTWTISDIQLVTEGYATAIVSGPNRELLVDLELGTEGLITRLFFENAGLREPPASMADLIDQLNAGGERTGMVVADVVGGECVATTDVRADEVLPIASTFKLYVLGALATAIAGGEVTWEQPVTIRPELRSPWIPLDVADGDTMTVRDLAQLMIEVSDNTATDHLIDLVGRDAVEEMLVTFGHHDPTVTLPMLTTREMSVLKTDPELLARYAAADEAGRRELLATEVAAAPTPGDADVWSEPRSVFDVEWFATPNDLCRALAGLHALSEQPGLEPVAEIMTTNPGLTVDPGALSSVWFKGGSEPGVLVGAWLAQRTDGTWLVAAGGAASSTATIDPAVIELVGSALSLGDP